MKRKITVLIFVIAALVVAAPASNGEALASGVPSPPGILGTATPQRRDFAETCRWFGKVESKQRARIIALATGRIVFIAAKDGILVAKGEPLFTIGGPLVDSRLRALRSRSATLQERIKLAEQMVRIKRDAVSQQFAKYEELASAQDALARLKAEMESAGQERQRLQEAIHLRATVGGVFTYRKVAVGQEVQKGDDLAEIISQNHIYIVATLFPKGGDVELKKKRAVINLAEGNSIQGSITTVLPERTAEGATVVWIEGPDLAPALRPGQTVSGTVVLSVHEKMLAVPQDAIVRDEEERAYVFLKDSSGYRGQPVRTGMVSHGWVEIISGLATGDEVVVRGAYELFHRDFNKIYKVAD